MFNWLKRLFDKQNDQQMLDGDAHPVLRDYVVILGQCPKCALAVVEGTESNVAVGPAIHKVCHTELLREATNDDPEMIIMMLRELRDFRNKTGITPNVSVI